MIVDAHSLQEVQLELLTISTQLRSKSIALALKLLLRDVERAQVLKSQLALDDLHVGILVVAYQTINLNLVLCDHGHHLVALSLTLSPIARVLKRDIDGVFVVRIRVLVLTGLLRL